MNDILEKSVVDANVMSEDDCSIRRIVVAVDLSTDSEKTAEYAAAFARSFGASLTLVHAFAPERLRKFTTEGVHERYEHNKRATEHELTELADSIRKTYPDCNTEFRVGDLAEEVNLVAKDLGADLIITACHHPGFLSCLFGLDEAPRILHRAQCAVLVYHDER